MEQVKQYAHYLIIISALLFAKLLLEPLIEMHDDLKQQLNAEQIRAEKLDALLSNKELLTIQLSNLELLSNQIDKHVFIAPDEASYKLAVQGLVRDLLIESNCSIDRIGWVGEEILSEHYKSWVLEARFTGETSCLLNSTRKVEEHDKLLRVKDFLFNGSGWSVILSKRMTGQLSIKSWVKISPEDKLND